MDLDSLTRDEIVELLAEFGLTPADVGEGYVNKEELKEALAEIMESSASLESDFEFVEEEDISAEHEANIQPVSGKRV